jgi:predicted dehydrogenase
VIATPTERHYEDTYAALIADKHVMIEKPIALSLSCARGLVNLSKVVDRVLMTDHIMLVHPAYLKMKEMTRRGAIGRVDYIEGLRYGATPRAEGIIWNLAPHDISMLIDLFGEPKDVYGCRIEKSSFEINLRWADKEASLVYEEGGGPRERELSIYGTKDVLSLNGNALSSLDGSIVVDETESLKLMAQEFVKSIEQGKATVSSGEDALRVIEVIEKWETG